MPEMDGDELCEHIRKDLGLSELPFIIMTALSEHKDILKIFKKGATDYINKPFAREELVGRLQSHLEFQLLRKTIKLNIKNI